MSDTEGYQWKKCALFDPNSVGYTVARRRYLVKDETSKVIEMPDDMLWRVARAVAAAEENYGLLQECPASVLAEQFHEIMAGGEFMPGSQILRNAGREHGACSACYALPVPDDLTDVMKVNNYAALLQKENSGIGINLSRIRPASGTCRGSGGTSAGPVPTLRMFSATAEAISQGDRVRRGNTAVLDIGHPDINRFLDVTQGTGKPSHFTLAVAVPDSFMLTARNNPDQPHTVRNPLTGQVYPLTKKDGTVWTVGEVLHLVAELARETGEPRLIFVDRINADNPTAHVAAIEATASCEDQPLPPYEGCVLGSINLLSFVYIRAGYPEFASGRLTEVVRLAVRFLDNVTDVERHPVDEIRAATLGSRRIGLGVMGLADMLFAMRIPYDSERGVEFAREVMGMVHEEACLASGRLAEERGCFPNWKGSSWEQSSVRTRNATLTCVAHTSDISTIAGCSNGIESVNALSFRRNIDGDHRFTESNPVFERTARNRGFYSPALMDAIAEGGSIQGMTHIPADVRRVFVTTNDIAPEWQVRMQAAIQSCCDGGVSKTITLPQSATVDDVRRIFLVADELKCKGITVHRDGSRLNQTMAIGSKPSGQLAAGEMPAYATPMDLPEIMSAVRIKQATPFGTMHVKVVVDPKTGREREIFAQLGKGGELAAADLEGMCRTCSLYLRVNGRIEDIVKQLDGIGTSMSIPTKDGRIASLADGLAKAVQKYLLAKKATGVEALLMGRADLSRIQHGVRTIEVETADPSLNRVTRGYRVKCTCGGDLTFEEGCVKCHSCGHAEC